ncbi:MAG: metallophosphoesterase [Prevotella sp.]|nr:metallophosphoesterase [Prevotella sp.]
MIARISIPVILAVLLASLYFHRYIWWHANRRLSRMLGWGASLIAIGVTLRLSFIPDYFPHNVFVLEGFLAMLFVYVIPLVLVALCGMIGLLCKRRRWGELVGLTLALFSLSVYVYGALIGFSKIEVKRVSLSFDDLPEAFDGYKIVHFTDAHVGTYTGFRKELLHRAVDSINAQQADAVVFTGDLQNMRPEEIEPHKALLASISARDGVFSVLGNHDYCEYIGSDDPFDLSRQMGLMVSTQQEMGWNLLCNSRKRLHRGKETMVIAGMENDGEGRFPQLGDINSALYGVSRHEFVIMLEHDPTSWRRKILPHSHAQLTLSGHTHDGQFSLFGWSPASLRYREYDGLYDVGGRMLYVSKGLGGVVPFRFCANPEIVVITLHKRI